MCPLLIGNGVVSRSWGRVLAVNSIVLKRTLSPALSHGMGEGAFSWWNSVVGLLSVVHKKGRMPL